MLNLPHVQPPKKGAEEEGIDFELEVKAIEPLDPYVPLLDMARRGDVGEWPGFKKMNNSKTWGICTHNWKEFLGTKVRLL